MDHDLFDEKQLLFRLEQLELELYRE